MPEIIRTRHRRHHDDYSSSSSSDRSPREGGYKTVRRYVIRDSDRDSEYRPRSPDRLESSTRIVERPRSYVEYDRELSYEREEPERRLRTVVYERDEPRSRELRPWETWEREDEVRVERRREEPQYELVTRETEYYTRPEPAQQLIIRQKAPEQRIIVETPPQPTVEVVRRHEIVDNREIPRPEPRREEDTYYRRHEIRDTASPEDNYYSERREVRRRGSGSEGEWSNEEGVVVPRTARGSSRSHSPHHKLHLAEGAAAGAAAGAIIAHHRSKSGLRHENKAAQVASGAILGTIGAELATRARSRYGHRSRSRGRSPSPEHSKLKMGLGAALVGVTALAAGKYFKDRRDDRRAEEARGRSRTRSRSRTRDVSAEHRHLDPKHRTNSIAKAGAAGAAAYAIAQAVRARSKSRKGERTRSKSRIRTGAEIVGAGLATAAAAGIYEKHQAKKEAKEEERERERSRSLSRPRSGYEEDGLVEYGASPLHSGHSASGYAADPLMINAPAHSDGAFGMGANRWRSRSRSRSKSRVREAVGAAAATAAAAVGVHKYRNRRRRREAEAAERERGLRRMIALSSFQNFHILLFCLDFGLQLPCGFEHQLTPLRLLLLP